MSPITLYVWVPVSGLPSSSPFCLKVMYALKQRGIPHKIKYVGARMPAWAKHGKLPVAEVNGVRGEDSSQILKILDDQDISTPKFFPEEPAAHADAFLLEDWADESFYIHSVYYSWGVDEHWEHFSKQIFAKAPLLARKLIAPLLRKGAIKMLHHHGIAGLSKQERADQYRASLAMLNQKIKGRKFFATDDAPAAIH